MLQDIGLGRYHNAFCVHEAQPEDYVLLYARGSVLADHENGMLQLPVIGRLPSARNTLQLRYGFSIDEKAYLIGDGSELELSDSLRAYHWVSGRDYRYMGPGTTAFACCVGESLHRWYSQNRFCGRCAAEMEDSKTERALVCPRCGLTLYPKICPAVIVAVCDGDRLLLTKYRGRAFQRYALVAGFNEIGETIEQTVHREVLEETGLRVKHLRFYKSQPWVITDSLLMGFFCALDGSDAVKLQEDELSLAQWFHRSELPEDHSGIRLTGEMIEYFRENGYQF